MLLFFFVINKHHLFSYDNILLIHISISRFLVQMIEQCLVLELLPNELLLQFFEYFQTVDLFRIFYNLNFRLNYLIQSLNHLTYSTHQTDLQHLAYPYIRTLIINTTINNRLPHFPNIRRLKLHYLTDDLISHLNGDHLPRLEYISINHQVHPYFMSNLRMKIFSNTLPTLKCCSIARMKPPNNLEQWTSTFSLQSLKLNDIDGSIYLAVLSVCPNLSTLKFRLVRKSPISSNIVVHGNLKRLLINMNYDQWPWEDGYLGDYLACAPNVEQFRISRSIARDPMLIDSLQDYDWLSSIITSHLLSLVRFQFYLYLNRSSAQVEWNFPDVCRDLKRSFNDVYCNRCESRLVVLGEF